VWTYILLFLASLLVDLVPFIGPPAWTVMVFFQINYNLNIWWVLVIGVIGSAMGRYLLALYMPYLGSKVLNKQKDEDLKFLGDKMNQHFWKTQAFVIFYTLLPIPSTPLFTVVGLSKTNPMRVIFAFFAGKFTSDALMVHAGKFAAENIDSLINGLLSWQTISGVIVGLLILFVILFIDWRTFLINKRFRLSFNIWK
jgi:membrane protein DedA with SNARE-associated domain